MEKPTDKELENRYRYHPSNDKTVFAKHCEITEVCLAAAKRIRDLTPFSREQSLALTHLQDAKHWANAALACNPEAGS